MGIYLNTEVLAWSQRLFRPWYLWFRCDTVSHPPNSLCDDVTHKTTRRWFWRAPNPSEESRWAGWIGMWLKGTSDDTKCNSLTRRNATWFKPAWDSTVKMGLGGRGHCHVNWIYLAQDRWHQWPKLINTIVKPIAPKRGATNIKLMRAT